MKSSFIPLILSLLLLGTLITRETNAQTTNLLAGNAINGAVTGTFLGVAVMGLQNDDDFAPLRIGLGAGILGGTGVAIYDVATLPQDQQFFISGTFNDGTNSSIIILLDTLYGTGGGAILGTAFMLIQNKPLVEGLQYGGSAGAWAGFGFGLIDAFTLSERNRDFTAHAILQRSSLMEYTAGDVNIGIGEPALYQAKIISDNSLVSSIEPGFKFLSVSKSF